MKKIFITFLLFIVGWNASAQSISRQVISSAGGTLTGGGNQINFTIGETVIATLSAGNAILTQGFQQPGDGASVSLNVKVFIEGFYRSAGVMSPVLFDLYNNGVGQNNNPTATDSITVNLWLVGQNNLIEETPSHSSKTVLHTNGIATCVFPNMIKGKSYYLGIVSRNGLETWSKTPLVMGTNNSFDFTTGY